MHIFLRTNVNTILNIYYRSILEIRNTLTVELSIHSFIRCLITVKQINILIVVEIVFTIVVTAICGRHSCTAEV